MEFAKNKVLLTGIIRLFCRLMDQTPDNGLLLSVTLGLLGCSSITLMTFSLELICTDLRYIGTRRILTGRCQ